MGDNTISFPPFELDLDGGQLLHDGQRVALRRRTWDVLCHLAARPGRLVPKDELLDSVWADAAVSEVTLSTSIRELRQVLGDDARSPRFIETVHRRGFRFLGGKPRSERTNEIKAAGAAPRIARKPRAALSLVGREETLAGLRSHLRCTQEGVPRLVLLRGEAGIGKSAVVSAFVEDTLASMPGLITATGRCIGFLQGAPPHLPVLDALERLASTPSYAARVARCLTEHAPELLLQLPWLGPSPPGGPRPGERRDPTVQLLRVLTELATETPLLLVLEDVHEADSATLDLLEAVTRSSRGPRLLVIATLRPAEVLIGSPARSAALGSIAASAGTITIDLALLDPDSVHSYLAHRDPEFWTAENCRRMYRHCGGNALFMVTVADTAELAGADGGRDLKLGMPESLRSLVEAQLSHLEFRQREVIAAASADGLEFSSLAVAAATGLSVEDVEAACEALANQGTLVDRAGITDWPSGSIGQSYRFRHELYRKALYDALPRSRRTTLHQRIGEAVEAGHAGSTGEVAAVLADHFEHSGDLLRAIRFLREAADVARARFAHRESLDFCAAALVLLGKAEPAENRDHLEFALQVDVAASAAALHGQGSTDSRDACTRVEVLARRLEPSVERFLGLLVVFRFRMLRAENRPATRVMEQMVAMARELDSPILELGADSCRGMVEMARGELESARTTFERVMADTPREFRLPNFRDVLIPLMTALAQVLCLLGEGEEASRIGRDAIARADWLDDLFEKACTRVYAAHCEALLGNADAARELAEDGGAIARAHGIAEMAAIANVIAGWADRGVPPGRRLERMRHGIRGLHDTGHLIGMGSYAVLVAAVEADAGLHDDALATVTEAIDFAEASDSSVYLAELYRETARIHGLASARAPRAGASRDAWAARARSLAQQQGAKLVLAKLDTDG